MSRPTRSRLHRLLLGRRRSRRSRREAGYIAVVSAIVISSLGFACAAVGVDTARWWVEVQRVQRAADMASLAGVTYLPQDLVSARATAIDVSTRNGYPNSGSSTVTAVTGNKASQLQVTVCSTIGNTFGSMIGLGAATVCRSAISDYTGPAPMGSPCNTFGNEPNSGVGTGSTAIGGALPAGTARGSSPYSNCSSNPQFWATIEGPQVNKEEGDRFQTLKCGATTTSGCDSSKNNTEYNPQGYYWLVRVQPSMVGQQINLELYDPVFTNTGSTCASSPQAANWTDAANDYVSDAKARYSSSANTSAGSTGAVYCTGDSFPSGQGSTVPVTSFALRQQTDTQNPSAAPVQTDTSGNACIKQFTGQNSAPSTNDLTKTNGAYDNLLAQTFHNWYSLCTFTPARAGDYYLQVRTNVTFGGTQLANTNSNPSIISTGNTNVLNATGNSTTGYGANSFAIRAVTPSGQEKGVSVSGYDRMPIYANANSATQTFNLIRVVPAGASKSIAFTFYDIGDASANATITVIPPADAKTTGNNTALSAQSTSVQFPGGCKAKGGYAGTGATYANCAATATNTANNGQTETLNIPIPNDYTCSYTQLNGCWYQVKVDFGAGTDVHDTTTWTANITGDPVRLIQ